MFGFATIAMFLASPDGWRCTAHAQIGTDIEISLSQVTGEQERTGKVALGSGSLQTLRWAGHAAQNPAGPPDALSLRIQLAKRDPQVLVSLELDGRSFYLPAAQALSWREGNAYDLRVDQPEVLEALWASAHWRVSVMDGKGVELGSIDGALPGRDAILAAFARLAPGLDGQLADPAKSCVANR